MMGMGGAQGGGGMPMGGMGFDPMSMMGGMGIPGMDPMNMGLDQSNPVTQGMGITPGPMDYTGYQQSPGLQQGTALAGDYSQQGPGAAEGYYGAAAPFYGQQGFGDQWWNKNQGEFGQPGAAENYQQKFQDKSEGLSANLDPYYDRAKERAFADIDKSFGARGMFGSSAATGQIGQTAADLEAQKARDEANYGLSRAAEQRAWQGLGGNLAGQAQQGELARLMGAGGLAQGFDANALNRVNSGMNAAMGAQDARRQRVQDMFGNVSAPGMALFGMQGQYLPQMIQNDQALMDASMLFGTGMAQDMVNSDRYATEKMRDDDRHVMDMFGSFMGGMAGM